ncbi:MAG: L,D-transpeptidase family protein [Pseudomonadota bacterium]
MKRLLAPLALLLATACSTAPPEDVVQAPGQGVVPASPAPQQQVRMIADYLLVDKSDRTLTAYNAGRAIRVYRGLQFGDVQFGHKQFEGDERTPEGLYTIDTRNPQSSYHLSLRISYPNSDDRAFARQYGRSPGGDIFIHGQPNGLPAGRVPGDWTDGCIALSNAEMRELWQLVPDGTPIEIRQ